MKNIENREGSLNRASNITSFPLDFEFTSERTHLFTGIVFKFHMHVHNIVDKEINLHLKELSHFSFFFLVLSLLFAFFLYAFSHPHLSSAGIWSAFYRPCGLSRVCATEMYRSIEHVKFPRFQTRIFVEWKALKILPNMVISNWLW